MYETDPTNPLPPQKPPRNPGMLLCAGGIILLLLAPVIYFGLPMLYDLACMESVGRYGSGPCSTSTLSIVNLATYGGMIIAALGGIVFLIRGFLRLQKP